MHEDLLEQLGYLAVEALLDLVDRGAQMAKTASQEVLDHKDLRERLGITD